MNIIEVNKQGIKLSFTTSIPNSHSPTQITPPLSSISEEDDENSSTQSAVGSNNHQIEIMAAKTSNTLPGKVWCYIAGRISCLFRIPIFGIAIALQGIKIVAKSIVSFIQVLVNTPKFAGIAIHNVWVKCFGGTAWTYTWSKIHKDWSFAGALLDVYATGYLAQRIVNSAWCFLVAPPRAYKEFLDAVSDCDQFVRKGAYHYAYAESKKFSSLTFFDAVSAKIPNYIKTITPRLRSEEEEAGQFVRVGNLIAERAGKPAYVTYG